MKKESKILAIKTNQIIDASYFYVIQKKFINYFIIFKLNIKK